MGDDPCKMLISIGELGEKYLQRLISQTSFPSSSSAVRSRLKGICDREAAEI